MMSNRERAEFLDRQMRVVFLVKEPNACSRVSCVATPNLIFNNRSNQSI